MGWNDSGKNNDPWGKPNKPAGPPDLDAILKNIKDKLLAGFGNKNTADKSPNTNPANFKLVPIAAVVIALILLVIWVLSGIFIVSPAERAVVLRFGKYQTVVEPGPHWLPRFVDSDYIVNVQRVANFSYQANMLTKDENIINVSVSVQYRIMNARDYLFNVVNPDSSLQQATASALRQVIGHTTLEEALTTGRQLVRDQVAKQLQLILSQYQSGLAVTDITLQSVKPPEEVTDAFNDAIKAREDQQSYINKADAYANQATAIAQGQSARIIQQADAYKQEVVLEAQAKTIDYLALLPAYQQSPVVTRERLYLSALESVLGKTSKVLVDGNIGSNMIYLPLDKLQTSAQQNTKRAAIQNNTPSAGKATANALPAASVDTEQNGSLNRPAYPTQGGY